MAIQIHKVLGVLHEPERRRPISSLRDSSCDEAPNPCHRCEVAKLLESPLLLKT